MKTVAHYHFWGGVIVAPSLSLSFSLSLSLSFTPVRQTLRWNTPSSLPSNGRWCLIHQKPIFDGRFPFSFPFTLALFQCLYLCVYFFSHSFSVLLANSFNAIFVFCGRLKPLHCDIVSVRFYVAFFFFFVCLFVEIFGRPSFIHVQERITERRVPA